MAFNRKAKLRDNIEAIKTLFEIEKANRKATPDERAVLERYCGFGGLKCILNPAKSLSDVSVWSKSDMELFPMVAELHGVIRTNCITEQEYKLYVNSLKNSILTAFYTPTEVVNALADALRNSGVTPNRFLDPSAGQGAFVSAFQSGSAAIDVMSFEKDLLTGKILTALYPDNKVRVEGFERIDSHYNNYFDVVSSNIPFGDVATFDPAFTNSGDKTRQLSTRAIHNYFFVKGLDTVREGGVLAFITSQGVMNSPQNEPIRQLLMQSADLVSAIRLPNNLFVDSANTEVGSDLIILQKHTAKQKLSPLERAFIETRPMDNGIMTNSYFGDLSRVVHTKSSVDTDPYGKPAMVYKHEGGVSAMAEDMAKMLKADFVERLNVDLYKGIDNSPKKIAISEPVAAPTLNFDAEPEIAQEEVTPIAKPRTLLTTLYDLFGMAVEERSQNRSRKASNRPKPATITAPRSLFDQPASTVQIDVPLSMDPREWKTQLEPHHKNGSLVIEPTTNQIGYLKDIHHYGATFQPLELNTTQTAKAKLYIPLRDSYQRLYTYEAERQEEDKPNREQLNTHYDEFVKRYGNLNSRDNSKLILMDVSGRDVLSLERAVNGQFIKADIFDHPVAFSLNEITKVDSPEEALSASLNKFGSVNLDYMASLSGMATDELIEELKGRIYFNPLVDK